MSKAEMLTDEQWAILEPLFQENRVGAGCPQIHFDREVLNGVLWVLRAGAAWADLPDRFPSSSTCCRRFSKWIKDGRLRKVLEALARHLEDKGLINLEECFIDGAFVVAKKGAQKLERPGGAKVRSSWLLLTLLVYLSPCTRILLTLMKSNLSRLRSMRLSQWDDPEELLVIVRMTEIRLMKPLLARELNLSRRTGKIVKKSPTQDGRSLRRYKIRWKIERLFAWLNKFKKAITRWEHCAERFTGLVHLAFSMILLRRIIKIDA